MPTTIGHLEPPLGNTRLQIARLVSALVLTNTHSVNIELAHLGTIGVLFVSFRDKSPAVKTSKPRIVDFISCCENYVLKKMIACMDR